jgi:hypothetical protein
MTRCRPPSMASDSETRAEGAAHGRLTRDRAADTSHCHHETWSAACSARSVCHTRRKR